jgi:hypothetical protein
VRAIEFGNVWIVDDRICCLAVEARRDAGDLNVEIFRADLAHILEFDQRPDAFPALRFPTKARTQRRGFGRVGDAFLIDVFVTGARLEQEFAGADCFGDRGFFRACGAMPG